MPPPYGDSTQPAIDHPSEATENGETTRRILEYARRNDIGHVLFASSREVYGENEELVCEESSAGPQNCTNPYAASKLFGEALCRSYQRCYGLNTGILRFSNVYGRYDDHDRVVPLFIAQATAGKELTVYGEGKVLDFVYLDDCVAGIERAIERVGQVAGEAVNIGSGRGTSIVEVAQQVADTIDACPGYDVQSERAGEPTKAVVGLDKTRALLDYHPEYRFEDGLAETIEWYQARPELLDSLV
ncbi:MAG: NAD-dependent epimerase/dehydratase family protein [Haloplanus sp.]